MPVGDLPGWRQVFTDDFTTPVPLGQFPSAVSTKWWAYPDGWPDTTGRGVYSPSRVVSIADGVMRLHLHTEGGVTRVAAPVPKVAGAPHSNGQRYGRYTVRFRADVLPGYKLAWLLWPDSEAWPADGEINFPEGDVGGRICAFLHHRGATSGLIQDQHCTTARSDAWHVATIEWTPTAATFLLDGETVGRSTSRIPDSSMHWVLQTETALRGPAPDEADAGDVEIDWVAIYAPDR